MVVVKFWLDDVAWPIRKYDEKHGRMATVLGGIVIAAVGSFAILVLLTDVLQVY